MEEIRSGIDLVNKEIANKIGFKFSREFEQLVIQAVSDAFLGDIDRYVPLIEEFFTAMAFRTFMGNMRYEEGGDRKFIPGDPCYNSKGYTFCDWSPYVWHTGLKNKIRAFCSGKFAGNRELLPDIGNYAMFCYILLENKPLSTYARPDCFDWEGLPGLYREYLDDTSEFALVTIAATALAEYFEPLHPKSQYIEMDQGIHGKEASGSARPTLDRWR